MKIFEINWESQGEKEWVSAETNIQALKVYCRITDMDLNDFEDSDSITEVPEEKWSEYTIRSEMDENNTTTFSEWMKNNRSPDIIAGTMYE